MEVNLFSVVFSFSFCSFFVYVLLLLLVLEWEFLLLFYRYFVKYFIGYSFLQVYWYFPDFIRLITIYHFCVSDW